MRLEAKEWVERGNYRVSKLYEFGEDCFIQLVEIKGKVGDHYHKVQTEVFVIVDGEGVMRIDGNDYEVSCGSVLLCKPGAIHSAEGNMKVLVFKYNYKEDDTFWLEK